MKPTILLVNPPIYDFTAYDFWLKPYGLLRVGGLLRDQTDLYLFDYMDRNQPDFDRTLAAKTTQWGCGPYIKTKIRKPEIFSKIPRFFYRFGRKNEMFRNVLHSKTPRFRMHPDLANLLVSRRQRGYRRRPPHPSARNYCIGRVLRNLLRATPRPSARTWSSKGQCAFSLVRKIATPYTTRIYVASLGLVPGASTSVIKLTQGCPFGCSYCYVPQSKVAFATRPVEECLEELDFLVGLGCTNIAFYDDALLYRPHEVLFPFLEAAIQRQYPVHFHTPNALHARFLTSEIAQLMIKAGVKTFYLGFESRSATFHGPSGGKVVSDDLVAAVEHLRGRGRI